MLKNFLTKVTGGDATDKALRRFLPLVDDINALEEDYEGLSDAELRAKTDQFRARIREHTAGAAARVDEVRGRIDMAMQQDDAARRAALESEFRQRERELVQVEQEILDELLVEAFAAVREAAKRSIGQRHFDVQLIGGAVLHSRQIAEMRTGEGKTLVATLPAYLNALLGHGVHVVTVNDYLARRDAAWMGKIYDRLGLTVGVLQGEGESFMYERGFDGGRYANLRPVRQRAVLWYTAKGPTTHYIPDRGEVYRADITYGTNNEFGFDYLRDNLANNLEDRVQRELYYAIVDEVDNIFIDEARTPLIISGFADEDVAEYRRWALIVRKLEPGVHYDVNEKERHVDLTTQGLSRVEELAEISNIYDESNSKYVHYLEQALSAQALFLKGREYIVQKGRVVLVDEHTGRLMADRRLSDGLHQAIEAKEAVADIRPRMVTQATITIQNYFRMYKKLAGMTGTAKSEQEEFYKIYTLDVVVIPTNVEYRAGRAEYGLQETRRKIDDFEQTVYVRRNDAKGQPVFFRRADYPDAVYRTADAKWQAIVDALTELHRSGRPVLVGTTSVEKSERLGAMLRQAGVPHQILNAKYHAEEAAIIARAGELGAVTVATNMAGRGVDIRLGGELKEETIREAQALLRRRGLDPFRVSDDQFYTAIAEVDPEHVRRRNRVLALGGLHVLGTERHDARRIDNQLRGRSGRQGEPGSSRFYVSLEDDMMRVFGGDRIDGVMKWAMGGDDSIPIEHQAVTRALDMTQARVEGYHFDTRKHVLEYDDVLNRQRDIIYGQRLRVLSKDDVHEDVWELVEDELGARLHPPDEKGRPRKQAAPLELFAWLDAIMPLAITPPTAAWRYPFRTVPALGNALPPFSLWFVANRLEGETGLALRDAVAALAGNALDGYRAEILERAIDEPLNNFFANEQAGLNELGNQLEEKTEEYILWQQEQEKPLQPRQFADHLKRVFAPLRGAPFTEVEATESGRVRKELEPYVEQAYYHQTTLDLLNKVYQAAQAFRGDWPLPYDVADDLIALAERSEGGDENSRAQKEIERLLTDLQKGADNRGDAAGRLARTNVFEVLVQIAAGGTLPLGPLGDFLRDVVTTGYDRWAERQRAEVTRALDEAMSRVREGTRDEVVQLLLDTFFYLRQGADQRHQKTVTYAMRMPLSYLALAAGEDLSEAQLREAVREVMDEAVAQREAAWGKAEHARLVAAGVTLDQLEAPALASLGRFWGQEMLATHEDTRVADLPAEVQTALRNWLTLSASEDRLVDELPDGAALTTYLAGLRVEAVRERWDKQSEETRQELEDALRAAGAFENPGAEGELLGRTLAELKPAFVAGLATRLGKAALDPVRFVPVTELPQQDLETVRAVLLQRGAFNDEKRVQHFLVEQQLTDLGEEAARAACLSLAAARLQRLGVYRIEELDAQMQALWQAAFRDTGRLNDPARQAHLLATPLGQLAPEDFAAIARGVGRHALAPCRRGADLPAAQQARALGYLARAGYFGRSPAAAFGPRAAERARAALAEDAHAALAARPVGELPEWLKRFVLAHLEECEYFIDHARARALAAQTVGGLDNGIVTGLEEYLGQALIAPMQESTVGALPEDDRAALLRFFDTRNLFKKKDLRQRLLATKVADLSSLQKGLHKDVAAHLGRERLNPVRNTRVGELPAGLREDVQRFLWRSESIEDREKREVVEMLPVTELETEVRAGVEQALAGELARLVETVPVDDLPPDVLEHVDAALRAEPAVLSDDRLAAFAALDPASLPEELRAGLERALGTAELQGELDRPLGALDGEAGQTLQPPAAGRALAAWQALEAAGRLRDPERERALFARRLEELAAGEPEAHRAAVAALAESLYNEAAARRVAELDDEMRQGLREALDRRQAFVDPEAVANFEGGRLADLRAPDYEAAVAAVGHMRLQALPDPRAPLRAWPEGLRAEAMAHAREEGLTLDNARLSAFRERGPRALPDLPAELLQRQARARLQGTLGTRRLRELDEALRRDIESYLETHSDGAAGAQLMAPMRNQRLGALDADLLAGFAGFWGRRRVARLAGTALAGLDEETGASLAEFFGQRMRQTLEKALMLMHVSRLWIDYLTEIENLRQGIGLQAFGQRDPLVEYKRRAFRLFDELRADIRRTVVGDLFAPQLSPPPIKLAQ